MKISVVRGSMSLGFATGDKHVYLKNYFRKQHMILGKFKYTFWIYTYVHVISYVLLIYGLSM